MVTLPMNCDFLQNKNILITGGTGSLGREVLKYDPKVVRVFDVDETDPFEFLHELKEHEATISPARGCPRQGEANPCCRGCRHNLPNCGIEHVSIIL